MYTNCIGDLNENAIKLAKKKYVLVLIKVQMYNQYTVQIWNKYLGQTSF